MLHMKVNHQHATEATSSVYHRKKRCFKFCVAALSVVIGVVCCVGILVWDTMSHTTNAIAQISRGNMHVSLSKSTLSEDPQNTGDITMSLATPELTDQAMLGVTLLDGSCSVTRPMDDGSQDIFLASFALTDPSDLVVAHDVVQHNMAMNLKLNDIDVAQITWLGAELSQYLLSGQSFSEYVTIACDLDVKARLFYTMHIICFNVNNGYI